MFVTYKYNSDPNDPEIWLVRDYEKREPYGLILPKFPLSDPNPCPDGPFVWLDTISIINSRCLVRDNNCRYQI